MNTADVVRRYLQEYPEDGERLALLRQQVADGESLQGRTNFTGHITAGAIVVSPDLQELLLIHHVFLGKWFQPGGHWDDGEASPCVAARREAEEETAVHIGRYVPLMPDQPDVPFRIDTHAIPANPQKDEPAHYHHDFRYLFVAADTMLDRKADEVHAVAWRRLDGGDVPAELEEDVRRARRLLG